MKVGHVLMIRGISEAEFQKVQQWYGEFLNWMTTHVYGIDERERKNNHGSAWVMQAAEYARLTGNEEVLQYCRDRVKNVLLPNQMGRYNTLLQRRHRKIHYSLKPDYSCYRTIYFCLQVYLKLPKLTKPEKNH